MIFVLAGVAAMHEEMHQRASQQQEVGPVPDPSSKIDPILGYQEGGRYEEENGAGDVGL